MRITSFLPLPIAILVLSTAGCSSQADTVPESSSSNLPSTVHLQLEPEAALEETGHSSLPNSVTTPIVFEGEVLERLKSDGFWCGGISSFQGIRYRTNNTDVCDENGEVVVYHYLVGPPHCEEDEPILSNRIFAIGNQLRVRINRHVSGKLYCTEAEENVQIIQQDLEP